MIFVDKPIVVVGDVMLDVYITGEACRISPEAPVPVVDVKSRKITLGGAGNVALNLAGLGCSPWLFGVRGDDAAGEQVLGILEERNIRIGIDIDDKLPTTTKTRIIANNQQLVRYDEEGRYNGNNGHYGEILASVCNAMESAASVILSDYRKGVVSKDVATKVIRRCKGLGIPCLVDPKRPDWSIFSGADLIKPNVYELEQATGERVESDVAVAAIGRMVLKKYGFGAVLITRGPKGMAMVTEDECEFIPTMAREVYDVSGAGDTVVAVMAACLGSGWSLADSARIANQAAGIVVGKLGTSPIDISELGQ